MINCKWRKSHKEMGCPILTLLLFGQSQEQHSNILMVSVVGLMSVLVARVAGQTDSWSTLYTATTNISSSTWVSRVVTSRSARSVLSCAGHCQDRQLSWGDCNSFTYQATTGQCEMGAITYLEDPAPGETAVRLMVVEDLVDSLKMYCRGGDGCCGVGSNRLCVEGEGDCDHDDQCAGVLECGEDNCVTKVSLSALPPSLPPSLPHSLTPS